MNDDVSKVLDFYDSSKNSDIFKKTHCLCNYDLNFCIINKNSDKLAQIYDGCNYKKQDYCSFIWYKNTINKGSLWQLFTCK